MAAMKDPNSDFLLSLRMNFKQRALRASDLFVRFEERLICLIFAVPFFCTHFVTRGVSLVNFTGLTLLKNINSTWNFC